MVSKVGSWPRGPEFESQVNLNIGTAQNKPYMIPTATEKRDILLVRKPAVQKLSSTLGKITWENLALAYITWKSFLVFDQPSSQYSSRFVVDNMTLGELS